MNRNQQSNEIVNEISLLYELSLSIGNSLNLHENCDLFIRKLLSRKNLNFASVWIKDSFLCYYDSDNAKTVYAYPQQMTAETEIPLTHPLFSLSECEEVLIVNSSDENYCRLITEKNTSTGTFFVFPLGSLGILKLYSIEEMKEAEYSRIARELRNVVLKFKVSVEACLMYSRSLREIQEKEKLAKELLYSKMEAESANRAKSDFLATMSHELRTPLNSVIGYSDFMLTDEADEICTRHKKYLNNIYTSGKHLLALINNVLDISKIEAGKMDLKYETFCVSETIDEVRMLISPLAHSKMIKIEYSVPPKPWKIQADRLKFKQILFNLASNAIKFTPNNGKITINASEKEGNVEISVKDTGIGISPQDMKKLFCAFTQLDSNINRPYEGTGLGLYLTKQFVEMHHGTINVQSEAGKGSNFTFAIPMINPHPEI